MKGAPIVVQGFGNAGQFAASLLEEMGMKVIAVSDSKGSIHKRDGLDIDSLRSHKLKNGTVAGFQGASSIDDSDLLELDCTVLVPAALENQITGANAGKVKAKIVAEASEWTHHTRCGRHLVRKWCFGYSRYPSQWRWSNSLLF